MHFGWFTYLQNGHARMITAGSCLIFLSLSVWNRSCVCFFKFKKAIKNWKWSFPIGYIKIYVTGADPGIFVRGGGVQLSENVDKQKQKRRRRRRRGDVGLWLFSFLQKNGLNQFGRQLIAYKFVFGGGGECRAWQVPLYTNTLMTW